MTTKFINIKDFRQNIAKYSENAQLGKERFIIMNRNTPLFEIKPFAKNVNLNSIIEDIIDAKKDVEKGRLYSHKEVLAQLS